MRARALTFVIGLAFVMPAAAARAQGSATETARGLFNEGLALRARGEIVPAIARLRAAYALRATPVIAYELGRAYVEHKDLVEAREVLLSIKRIAPNPAGESKDTQTARRESATLAEALRPRIASLTVTLAGPGAAAKPALLIDGIEVPAAAASEPQRLNPTTHHVVARGAGAKETSSDVTLREGESARIVLDIAEDPNATSGADVGEPGSNRAPARSAPLPAALTYGGFSLGFIGVAVGTITGVSALDRVAALNSSCTSSKICTPDLGDEISGSRALGNVSTLSFVAAGIGVALGVIGLLIWPRVPATRATATTPGVAR